MRCPDLIRKTALILLGSTLGCSGADKAKPSKEVGPPAEAVEKFEAANRLLDAGEYAAAEVGYQKLLVGNPVSSFDHVVRFNLAASKEGRQDCAGAIEQYRKIIGGTRKTDPVIYAMALFRLSGAQLCVNQPEKAVISLKEIAKNKQYLPLEVREAQYPARLAVAYGLVGNRKEAQFYLSQAQLGLEKIQQQNLDHTRKRELLARTLLAMGQLPLMTNPSSLPWRQYLALSRELQGYLLKAVEFDVGQVSKVAADQLLSGFDRTFVYLRLLDGAVSGSDALATRGEQKEKNDLVGSTLENIVLLRSQRFPEDMNRPQVVQVFSEIREKERKLQSYLATHVVGSSLTPEEADRRSLQRGPVPAKKPTAKPPKAKQVKP